jgi:hypothetical protein
MAAETSPTAATSPGARRQALVTVVLLVAAAGVGLLLLELRARGGELEVLAAAACRGDAAAASELRRYLHVVLGLVPASALAFAGYVGVLARRVRREERFPPSSSWMLGRPRFTFEGAAARRFAALMFAFAGMLALLALLLGAIGLRMLSLLDR